MAKQISLEEAKRLAILKWVAHVKAGGYNSHLIEELRKLEFHCGFCERWKDQEEMMTPDCRKCEFGQLAGFCSDEHSLYDNWLHSEGDNLSLAKSILNIIKSIE